MRRGGTGGRRDWVTGRWWSSRGRMRLRLRLRLGVKMLIKLHDLDKRGGDGTSACVR